MKLPLTHLDFIKADADGPEGTWLARIAELIEGGRLSVPTIVIECNGCQPRTLFKLQVCYHFGTVLRLLPNAGPDTEPHMLCPSPQRDLGYHVYLMDMHIDQRFLNAKGIDVYGHFASRPLPEFVEERYSIRLLRHVYYLADNMTLAQWSSASYTGWRRPLTRKLNNQYILTREQLLEPRREHHENRDSPIRKESGYSGTSEDGLS